jgi:hypothetical protein
MGTFDEVIAELKTRRDKITVAIEALEELSGGTSNESSVRENRTVAVEPKTTRRVDGAIGDPEAADLEAGNDRTRCLRPVFQDLLDSLTQSCGLPSRRSADPD